MVDVGQVRGLYDGPGAAADRRGDGTAAGPKLVEVALGELIAGIDLVAGVELVEVMLGGLVARRSRGLPELR